MSRLVESIAVGISLVIVGEVAAAQQVEPQQTAAQRIFSKCAESVLTLEVLSPAGESVALGSGVAIG